jgi:hypothetical protein
MLKYPARSSLSFVMALFTAGKSEAAQYDCLLPAVILACFSDTPSFRRLWYFVRGFFHCFQMYILYRRLSH